MYGPWKGKKNPADRRYLPDRFFEAPCSKLQETLDP
jgi:hypothetical protein